MHEELPDEFIISVDDTVSALRKVKTNKSTGPDNIHAWVLMEHAVVFRTLYGCNPTRGVANKRVSLFLAISQIP